MSHSSSRECWWHLALNFYLWTTVQFYFQVSHFLSSLVQAKGWVTCINKVFPTLPLTKNEIVLCLLPSVVVCVPACMQLRYIYCCTSTLFDREQQRDSWFPLARMGNSTRNMDKDAALTLYLFSLGPHFFFFFSLFPTRVKNNFTCDLASTMS